MENKKKSVKSLKMFLNKDKDELILNPEISDQRKAMAEATEKHGVMAYGRMNPPTTGHAALINKVHEVAKQHKASHVVIASHSQDKKKNPLAGEDKLKHLNRFFPKTNIELATKEHPTFLQHATKLHKQGVTHLHMVAGSDRVDEFKQKLHQYNGSEEGKLFNFKHIEVHSSGERDPDAEGTEGMSASKMREHAKNNDYESFKKGIPSHVKDAHAKELFHDVRKGMELKEGIEEAVLDISARRKRAINLKKRHSRLVRQKQLALKRFASDLKLRRRARNVARALVRTRVAGKRGASYANLSVNDKMAVDRMIQGKEKLVKAIAGKLYQRIRKREAERVSRVRSGLTAKRQGKILNAEFDYSVFSSMYDTLVESNFVITEKELLALNIKAKKHNIELSVLENVYRGAAASYTDSERTLQQYCFDRVNAFIAESKKDVDEDLRQWFKDKWVRMDTKGNIKGDCAREPGEGKPKCLPLAKASSMDKEDRASAVRRKRREDPIADRPGKGGAPVNVRTEAVNRAQQAAIAIALIKAGKKKGKNPGPQEEFGIDETKSAPKGFHFTRDGKLKRGDADRDGDGGKMLRSDPLDKQRNKIPQVSEDVLNEKNAPTNPGLWSRAKALAKSKFDVYPSAYANGWAAKWYKSKGGGWRSVSEEVSIPDETTNRIKKITKQLDKSAKTHHKQSVALKRLIDKDEADVDENFMDGKNAQDKGDMARHGLKGKSIAQLKKIRSSDTASPRKKQLAHWFINMHSEEVTKTDQGAVKGHLQAATKLQQKGNYKKAGVHRKIASALARGDKTSAAGFKNELRSIEESFVLDRASGIGVTYTAADLGIKTKGGFAHHPSVLEKMINDGLLEGEELKKALDELSNCNYNLKKVKRPNE